jgi:hypothetical protein
MSVGEAAAPSLDHPKPLTIGIGFSSWRINTIRE